LLGVPGGDQAALAEIPSGVHGHCNLRARHPGVAGTQKKLVPSLVLLYSLVRVPTSELLLLSRPLREFFDQFVNAHVTLSRLGLPSDELEGSGKPTGRGTGLLVVGGRLPPLEADGTSVFELEECVVLIVRPPHITHSEDRSTRIIGFVLIEDYVSRPFAVPLLG
jgi:hypothetical protein